MDKRLNTAWQDVAQEQWCLAQYFLHCLNYTYVCKLVTVTSTLRSPGLQTYWDYKQASQSYQQAWQQLLDQAFPLWPRGDRRLLLFQ